MAEVLDIVVRQRGARRVSKDIAQIGVSATSVTARLKTMSVAFKGSTAAMTQASKASGQFVVACQKTSRCTNLAAKGLKKTRLGLSGVGTGAFVAGAALTAGFTRPLLALIGVAGDFQQAMNLVGVLTNVDRASVAFENLRQTALELGRTTQFTAVQAAEGMAFLAQAGFEADEVLKVIPSTLNLAAAAAIDLGRASDIATNILKGFQIGIEDLPKSIDILAATFSSSNVNIEQLAASFQKVGPVAVKFGQRFEDVAAIVGALGDAGIQAEAAGTALRRIFINLETDAAKSNSTLRKFGIVIRDDVTGKMRPLIKIFQELVKAGLAPAESIKLFGARALASAGIIEDTSEGLEKFANLLLNSVGRAAEIGAARLEGFKGSSKLLTSALEGLGIAIADSGILDFFTKIVDGLTTAARAATNLPKPILFLAGVILTLGAALGAILLPIGLIAVGLSTLQPLFAAGFVATLTAWGVTIGGLLLTMLPFVAAIVALVVAWQLLKDIQFTIGDSTVTLSNLFFELGDSIVETGREAVLGFKLLVQGSGSTVNALAKDSVSITDNLPSFTEFVASGLASFTIFGRVVASIFVRLKKAVSSFATDAVNTIKLIPEAVKAFFDGDDSTNVGEILARNFKNQFFEEFKGFGAEVKAIAEKATREANLALSFIGDTDFVKRAAARTAASATDKEKGGDKKGTGAADDPSSGPATAFNAQQIASAKAVDKLSQSLVPGIDLILKMVAATNALNTAQLNGAISGEKNVKVLAALREEGGEAFLASINPVTAAYRDQRIALERLAVAKELFNLTDQEALIAGQLIQEQMMNRLLQLDQFKEKLSLIDATRMGLDVGFKNFVKNLGTSFDIVAASVEELGNIISNSLTTAIKEGEFSFKEFALTVVSAIQQMITQLLIQIALQAILTALGGGAVAGSGTTSAGSGGGLLSVAVPRAGGGFAGAGQTFLVGEEGPELFVPKSSGDIIPNGQTSGLMGAQPAPIVNVQVVNVVDESGIPDAMNTVEGERVILNIIQRNRNQLKEIL